MTDAERSVAAATRIRLDRNRQQTALRRIRTAREILKHHESMAAAERGKIAQLVRTWELCPGSSPCCLNPEACERPLADR